MSVAYQEIIKGETLLRAAPRKNLRAAARQNL